MDGVDSDEEVLSDVDCFNDDDEEMYGSMFNTRDSGSDSEEESDSGDESEEESGEEDVRGTGWRAIGEEPIRRLLSSTVLHS